MVGLTRVHTSPKLDRPGGVKLRMVYGVLGTSVVDPDPNWIRIQEPKRQKV